ncbi:DUF2207 domain-containing protein [Crocosphaera watsonii]|uniref:DUF2207 domain-containing protein n=1 Tax=Crocosphaera watsonii WH 0401 TaxID=555881 RepID=T2J5D0_CROWT|nr:DUF2207 domain-containing protein [Crocosphaera watsonii]CCQ60341.1 unknown protein [Crocosphaera watsonii WH 0401]
MSPENSQLYQRIQAFALEQSDEPLSFSKRLAKENQWSLSYANRVIEEYKKFTFLAVVSGHTVSPSKPVDQAWHLHLTYTRSYWQEFCPHILQMSLHHEPSSGALADEVKFNGCYEQTLKSYQTFFREIPPSDIWGTPMEKSQQDNPQNSISLFPKKLVKLILVTILIWFFLGLNMTPVDLMYLNSQRLTNHDSALAIPLSDYPYYWDFVNVNIDAKADGSMIVEEVQKYTFNKPWTNERHRFIRLDKLDDIQNVSVTENGQILENKTSIKDQRFYIQWFHPLNALDGPESHVFTLRYKVFGGLHQQGTSDQDELYWKAIFPKRRSPILKAKITVNLPPELEDKIIDFESLGHSTSKKQIDPQTIEFVALNKISPSEGIAIEGTFPHHILNLEPPTQGFSKDSSNTETSVFEDIIGLCVIVFFFVILPIVFLTQGNGSSSSSQYSSARYSSGRSRGGGSSCSSGGGSSCSSGGGSSCGSSCGGGCGGGD